MLCEPFSLAEAKSFRMASKDTNGVERVNIDSKQTTAVCLRASMEFLHKKDKCIALAYIASEQEFSFSYIEINQNKVEESWLPREGSNVQ